MEKFEDYLKELSEIVEELENGNLTLDESINKYKRGLELSKLCKQKLDEAKNVIVTKVDE